MGKADISTKDFLKVSEIFAELFNMAVFQGDDGITPADLVELDSVTDTALNLAEGQLKFVERARDVKKLAKIGIWFRIILGVEGQTDIHYYMPVRNMGYDAADYETQCKQIRTQALAGGIDFNPVNGIPKGTKILPVITLVFYVGEKPWDGPRELYDMFDIPGERKEWAKRYIPNYPLHILDARHLTDDQIELCSDDLKAFFYMIREDYDEDKLKGYVAKFRETWYAISAVKDDKRYAKYYDQSLKKSVDGGVRVDAVLDRIEARGEKRGITIGEKRGIIIGEDKGVAMSAQVFKAVQSGQRDNQIIAEQCGCTIEQVVKIRKEFEI